MGSGKVGSMSESEEVVRIADAMDALVIEARSIRSQMKEQRDELNKRLSAFDQWIVEAEDVRARAVVALATLVLR
jgi:hypothetical protein